MNFEEQLREIDTAILPITLNQANPPFTDSFSDIADNTTKKVDDLNLKRMGTEVDKVMGPAVGLTSEMGLSEIGLDLEPSLSHGNTMGHEISQAHNLFSIGSYTTKPLGRTRTREVMGSGQKMKRQARKGVGKENFMQEERSHEYGAEEGHDMVKMTIDNDIGPKRKLCSPLKEIVMEEDMGKKQKIEGEVLVLSKLMAQQLGLAVAARQPC